MDKSCRGNRDKCGTRKRRKVGEESLRVEMSGHKGRTCRPGRLKRQTWEGRKDGEKL